MTDALTYAISSLRRAAEKGHPWSVLSNEVASALVAEVERLRDEVAMLQQEARIRKNLCDGFASEVATERAAVVAYLRTRPGYGPVADTIERGEHRREE